jgi:DNA-directed RNA polymerase subunit RPC12/RpoP
MAIEFKCPACGRDVRVADSAAGKHGKCPHCGVKIAVPDPKAEAKIPSPAEFLASLEIQPASPQARSTTMPAAQSHAASHDPNKTWEYKVLTQKDKWFSGKFDPAQLEAALNSYAGQGWRVLAVTTASIPGFGGNRDEMVVILER